MVVWTQTIAVALGSADAEGAQAGMVLSAGYFAAVVHWIGSEPEPFDLPAYLNDLLDLILRGLV